MMTVRLDRRLELMTKAFEAKKDGIEKQQDLKDKQDLFLVNCFGVFGIGILLYNMTMQGSYGSKGP